MSKRQNILITLTGRYLDEREADELRAFVAALRPKLHLVMADWPWIEVRGLTSEVARHLVERVRAIVPRCTVAGLERNASARRQPTTISAANVERLAA